MKIHIKMNNLKKFSFSIEKNHLNNQFYSKLFPGFIFLYYYGSTELPFSIVFDRQDRSSVRNGQDRPGT